MAEAYNLAGTEKALYFENLDDFLRELRALRIPFKKDDTILIKASHGMKFSEILSELK